MKTLILILITVLLLADCSEKPRIKRKTTEQIKKDRSVSKEKEDNRRTVGVRKRRRRRSSSSGSDSEPTTPEPTEADQLENEAIDTGIIALKNAVSGLSTTIHNGNCPDTLYTGTGERNFDNKLDVIRFYRGGKEDVKFISKINVKTRGKAVVYFQKSALQSFAGNSYTWFLYFEDRDMRDVRNSQYSDIQYKAIQFKVSEATETTDTLYKFGTEDSGGIANDDAKTIDPHVLEYIANVSNTRGHELHNNWANIVFAIQTRSKCIEVYVE